MTAASPAPHHELSAEDKAQLAAMYRQCLMRVAAAAAETPAALRPPAEKEKAERGVRLVAVSKTHPAPVLRAVYDAGCRVFGENYTYEVVEKAPLLPSDIAWRFIGHLQSNKVKELLTACPSLQCVETVDTEKLARKLKEGVTAFRGGRPLSVMVQVNTSGEDSKSGVEPAAAVPLALFIAKECAPELVLEGFMTIGMPDYTSRPENFARLVEVRAAVTEALTAEGLLTASAAAAAAPFELSMGMSGDFESAIAMGSTNVRVGTGIFGRRNYPPKAAEGGETAAPAAAVVGVEGGEAVPPAAPAVN